MKFISIRDLRNKPAQIQKELPVEKEIILTSNGKPIAILSTISGDTLENTLNMLRRIRAVVSVTKLQIDSIKLGKDRMTIDEIDEEIAFVRKRRRGK